MNSHLGVCRKTVWHFENKERIGEVCVRLRVRLHDLTFSYAITFLWSMFNSGEIFEKSGWDARRSHVVIHLKLSAIAVQFWPALEYVDKC